MAGQYAKPRSADMETRDGVTLPSYRGDLVNRPEFTPAARAPDPQLLLRGYERAALTLNFVRALIDGGFADLHHPEYWDLGFLKHSPLKDAYQRIANSIADSLDFFEGISGRPIHEAAQTNFYCSHEGLHLLYEQAQTRFIPRQQRWYNLSTHYPWIGMRTAQLDGAHVEYFRGISNPVGREGEQRHGRCLGAGPGDDAESAEPARPADLHPSLRRQGHREVAAAPDQGGARDRPERAVGVRSDARQYRDQHRGV